MISQDDLQYHILADRSHLGEYVYGQKYRDYNGNYVFELERKYKLNICVNVYLIVFIDTSLKCIEREDGHSFTIDPIEKQKENEKFVEAFNKSNIKNKILIDIKDKDIETIHQEITKFIGY